jgi:hypothetical protein
MNTKNTIGIIILGCFIFLVIELARKPSPPRGGIPTAATNALVQTNVLPSTNVWARAALSNALLRVRADLAKTTNTDEIAALRVMEQSLTNALAKP